MTLRELRKLVEATPSKHDDVEVKVWLPGSTIRLNAMGKGLRLYEGNLIMEGNVDPGSALMDD